MLSRPIFLVGDTQSGNGAAEQAEQPAAEEEATPAPAVVSVLLLLISRLTIFRSFEERSCTCCVDGHKDGSDTSQSRESYFFANLDGSGVSGLHTFVIVEN